MSFHVITASAGSGKTYRLTEVLSERLSAEPTDGRAPLRASEIIATTFTVRAAADLVEKTQKRLIDDGNLAAADEISTALIGTIHSMSGRFVSDYAIDAGFSPELRVLDEAEQKAAFRTAVDDVVAEAEAENRALLARTGHNGDADDEDRFGGPIVWSSLVRTVAEAARENDLGPADLSSSAEASVAEFLGALPTADGDGRGAWRDALAADIEELKEALFAVDANPGEPTRHGIVVKKGSKGNVEGSIITLDWYLRGIEASGGDVPFDTVPWSSWQRIAESNFTAAGGGKKPGKVPVELLSSSSGALVTDELLQNSMLHADIAALIRLVMDTAAKSLAAYEDYKNRLGVMDFVDQEVRALQLLQTDERVRASIASRYRLLAVDEFQDTSPIQLAIFMELAGLVDDVIWVGDRKQAIYGFRGADPELMDDVFAALVAGRSSLGHASTENLGHSWRSSAPTLDLSNAIFSSVFADQPITGVALDIPSPRRHLRETGGREIWVPDSDKGRSSAANARLSTTIAEGIVELLRREELIPDPDGQHSDGSLAQRPVRPGDIAVLLRTNSQVDQVVAKLRARGVPATGSAVDLLQTREGQFVRAGLALIVDDHDTIALTELVTLMRDHASHDTWFDDAVTIRDREFRKSFPATWWDDDALAALHELRAAAVEHTPSSLLLATIDALDLPQRIKAWSNPEARLANLDGLRRLTREFEDGAVATSSAVSAAGLLDHLAEFGPEYDGATAHEAVLVTTMHQSKGLQWPVVVTGIPQHKDFGHRPVSVRKADDFDASAPLAGRSIRFLPKVLLSFTPLTERLRRTETVSVTAAAERRETARLLYVGLTRAETWGALAFATPAGEDNALNASVREEMLEWSEPAPDSTGDLRIRDRRGDASAWTALPTNIRSYACDADATELGADETSTSSFAFTDVPMRRPTEAMDRLPARFAPSGVDSTGLSAQVKTIAELGEPLVSKGGMNWDRVGDAVHSFLALPYSRLDATAARSSAARIVDRWGVGHIVSTDVLLEAGRRWSAWAAESFPGAEVLTETPIAWRNPAGQVMEGWIDARIVFPDGRHILVDHKSFPGADAEGHIRELYLGQFTAYAKALEAMTGSRPERILVHLPLLGTVVEVSELG